MKNTFLRKGLMTLAVISGSTIATIASAQAPTAIDLGTLPRCLVTSSGTLTGPGGVVWFKFTIPAPGIDRAAGTFLDLDTEGTNITGGTFTNDTMLALFDGSGTFLNIDDDSGTNALSRLSYGLDTPARPSPGNGLTYAGGNGATLAAGTYYAAAFDYSGTRTVATPWNVTVQGTAGGTINFRVLSGPILGGTTGVPATFTNLGTLVTDGNFVTNTLSLSPGTPVRWFKFTLGSSIAGAQLGYLDIDTEGTTGLTATSIAVFSAATTNLVAQDTNSGTDNLSQLSFGYGTGRDAPGNGLPYNGRNGATLAAGDYYIAVTGAPASFTNNYGFASCAAPNSTNVKLNVRAGVAPPPPGPTPLQRDFGTLTPGTVSETGAAIGSGEVKWYKLVLPDIPGPGNTRRYLDIDTENTNMTGVDNNDTMLGLYGVSGTLVVSDDDDGTGLLSLLSFGAGVRPAVGTGAARTGQDGTLAAGTYYLAAAGYLCTFGTNFGVTTDSTDTGTIDVNINFGTSPVVVAPTPVRDFGAIATGTTVDSARPLDTAGQVLWYKVTLPDVPGLANQRRFLDIHTGDSALSGNNDTEIGLYTAAGALRANDDDSGPGALSQLSFGIGTRPAIGNGLARTGQNGTIVAGDYYIAVAGYNAAFANADWGVTTTSTDTGTINLNLIYGTTPVPVAPTPVRNFGNVATGTTTDANRALAAGQILWYQITLPDIPGLAGERRFLDIDTEGSSISGNNDLELGLFTAPGAVRSTDDNSGTDLLPQLSYGTGTRPAPGNGLARTGQNGVITAGTYYIAVGAFDTAFAADWTAVSGSTDTGTVNLNINFGVTPPAAPPTNIASDLGTVTSSNSPRRTPDLSIGAAQFVWVKFTTPAATNATDRFVDVNTNGSVISDGGTFGPDDTEIGVYNSTGTLVSSNDDWDLVATPVVRLSGLTWGQTAPARDYGAVLNMNGRTGAVLPAGTYYAAAGAYNIDFGVEFGANATNTQTGTVAVTVATNFPGQSGCNAADITNLGGSGGPDGQLTVDDLIKYLSWFLTGDIRADLTNLGGTGAPDGQLTADDLIKYLNLFLTAPGC